MRFDGPQQGEFKDCWFVAALSSYLFVNFRQVPKANNQGKYTFPFYNGKKWISVATSSKVCYKNGIWGAKEIANDLIYSWPAVYEKAYAAFREDPKVDPPNMLKYIHCEGNPLTCLEHISGSNPHAFFTSYLNDDNIFSTIQDQTNPVTGESNSVSFPFVAWTTSGNGNFGIKANHSYSILGTFQKPGDKCIILRDPKAELNPNSEEIYWDYIDFQTYKTTVHCDPTLINKGIFAITPAAFKASFEGFGYVR